MVSLHYFGIIFIAAAVNFIIGFLIHGPVAGKLWMKLAHIHPTGKEKFKDMIPQMVKNFVMNLLCAFVLSIFIGLLGGNIYTALLVSFLIWLGFIFTGSSMDVIWMGKSWKLWCFEAVSSLVSIVAMGVIISIW